MGANFGLVRKGVRHLLPERPAGCFAQKVPDTFSNPQTFHCRMFIPGSEKCQPGCKGIRRGLHQPLSTDGMFAPARHCFREAVAHVGDTWVRTQGGQSPGRVPVAQAVGSSNGSGETESIGRRNGSSADSLG